METHRHLATGLGVFLIAAPALGGGFLFDHQSAKAMGMGGAFVAQAQDPSAVFFNPGALALLEPDPKFSAGLAVCGLNESLYQGRPPGIGTGATAEQEGLNKLVPHAFLQQALGDHARLGFGVSSPFLLETEWANPDDFVGRYSAVEASVTTTDLSIAAAARVGESVGLGAAVIYRLSDLSLLRRRSSFDPVAGQVVDVASFDLDAPEDDSFGWSAGLLYRGGAFSWGLSYHSSIEIDYEGTGKLTQIPTDNEALDELIAATLPLDEDLAFASRIEFPDRLTLGAAIHPGRRVIVEVDVDQVGWSSFQSLPLVFPNNPELDDLRTQGYDDTMGYRIGASVETAGGTVFRGGLGFAETPQPDAALGAFFPDGDRTSYHVGLSRDWLDVALVWVDVAERIVTTSSDGLNGAYNGNAWVVAFTINK